MNHEEQLLRNLELINAKVSYFQLKLIETQTEIVKAQDKNNKTKSTKKFRTKTNMLQIIIGSKEESKVFESQSNKSLKVPNNLPLFRTGNNSFKDPERLLIAFRRVLIAHGLNENENWNILLPICTSEYVAFWIERNINPDFSFEGMQKSLIRQYTNVFRDQRLVKQLLLMKPFD
ncbi:hypothetical protein BB558_007428 [Smittium angustum]|uniref:Uncharacterized protein n=2 Tax=Smittium angustum TaxID=133377 RepID=A0A2U1IV15_SMIAN|nr:hypothetical protein BB558_007428 [Smittium angustum]